MPHMPSSNHDKSLQNPNSSINSKIKNRLRKRKIKVRRKESSDNEYYDDFGLRNALRKKSLRKLSVYQWMRSPIYIKNDSTYLCNFVQNRNILRTKFESEDLFNFCSPDNVESEGTEDGRETETDLSFSESFSEGGEDADGEESSDCNSLDFKNIRKRSNSRCYDTVSDNDSLADLPSPFIKEMIGPLPFFSFERAMEETCNILNNFRLSYFSVCYEDIVSEGDLGDVEDCTETPVSESGFEECDETDLSELELGWKEKYLRYMFRMRS